MTLHITEGPTHTLYEHRCCGCDATAGNPVDSMTQANLEALANEWELTQRHSWCPECALANVVLEVGEEKVRIANG